MFCLVWFDCVFFCKYRLVIVGMCVVYFVGICYDVSVCNGIISLFYCLSYLRVIFLFTSVDHLNVHPFLELFSTFDASVCLL